MGLKITDHDEDDSSDESGLSLSRRSALKTVGATAAVSGVAGHSYFSESSSAQAGSVNNTEVHTNCWVGKQDCGMVAQVVNDRVVHLKPDPEDPTLEGVCPKGVGQIADLYDPYRVKQPLRRTNEKGEPGEFEPIDWDTAISEIGEDFRSKAEDDARRINFQTGRPNNNAPYHRGMWHPSINENFDNEINDRGHDACCANANKWATSRITSGFSSIQPDWEETNFMISVGWNATQAGGPHLCNVSFSNDMAMAYEDGCDIAVIDPTRRNAGQWCDDWLPIEPGTDLAFFTAFNKILVEEGYIDERFLEKNTNFPCLVYTEGPNAGQIARAEDAEDPAEAVMWCEGELVYDREAGEIVTHEESLPDEPLDATARGTAELDPDEALTWNGNEVQTAWQLWTAHLEDQSLNQLADDCDIPRHQIERVATKFGEEAQIGATKTIEYNGYEATVRYSPVSISTYHALQVELGVNATHSILNALMTVGAIDCPGMGRTGYHPHPYTPSRERSKQKAFNPDEYLHDEPDHPSHEMMGHADGTYLHPASNDAYGKVGYMMANADDYNLPYDPSEMALITHVADPVSSGPNYDHTLEGYAEYDTVVCPDPFMSDVASLCADYVLPVTTMDKAGHGAGPFSTTHMNTESTRSNPLDGWKMYDAWDDGDVFAAIADEMGIGDTFLGHLNDSFGTDYASLDDIGQPGERVETIHHDMYDDPENTSGGVAEDIADRYPVLYAWRSGEGTNWFGGTDVNLAENRDHPDVPGRPDLAPQGFKYEPYQEAWHLIGEECRGAFEDGTATFTPPGLDDYEHDFPPHLKQLIPLPAWGSASFGDLSYDFDIYPTMWDSGDDYPFTLFDHKTMEHKQSRTNQNPLLNEIEPGSQVRMHPDTADEIGVDQGDQVEVTAHNAFTDEEVNTQEGTVLTMENVKPGTICIPAHHYSEEGPNVKALDEGINSNKLFVSTEGYCTWATDTSFQIRVDVDPAGGDA